MLLQQKLFYSKLNYVIFSTKLVPIIFFMKLTVFVTQRDIKKLGKERMISFLSKRGILSTSQFGFMNKKSTGDAIFKIFGKLHQDLNQKPKALICTVPKAFDCVDRVILII